MFKSIKVTETDPKNYVIGRWNYFATSKFWLRTFLVETWDTN